MATAEREIKTKREPSPDEIIGRLGGDHRATDSANIMERVENARAVWYAWHPWMDLNNLGGGGPLFGVPYGTLKRMSLIPLSVFLVPKILPRSVGFQPQNWAGGGEMTKDEQGLVSADIFQSYAPLAKVGGKVIQEDQMPSVSAKNLLKAHRDTGMTILTSLTAPDEIRRAQSLLLYHAIMDSPVETDDEESHTGGEVRLQDLAFNTLTQRPGFLDVTAPLLLERALRDGVRLPMGEDEAGVLTYRMVKLNPELERNGLMLIDELKDGVERATDRAIGEQMGILTATAKEMAAARMSQSGNKIQMDKRDKWLAAEFYDFSLDSESERASKTAVAAVAAGREGSAGSEGRMLAMLENQQKFNEMVAKRLFGEEKKSKGKNAEE